MRGIDSDVADRYLVIGAVDEIGDGRRSHLTGTAEDQDASHGSIASNALGLIPPGMFSAPHADHIEDREEQEDHEGDRRADERADETGERVAQEREQRLLRSEEVLDRDRIAQVGMAAQIVEQQKPRDAGADPDDRVRNDGGGLVPSCPNAVCTGYDRSRKRDDRHGEQEDQVPPEDTCVDRADPREHGVVAHPQHADIRERRQVRDVAHPLVAQLLGELPARGWDRELEDEQRDGDREHAITERFDPVALAEAGSSSIAHVRNPAPFEVGKYPSRCSPIATR